MALKERLEEYTSAARDLAVFDGIYRDVMKKRALLQKRVDDLDKQIKEEAHRLNLPEAEEKTSVVAENRYFKVTYTRKEGVSYDAERLVSIFPFALELEGVITRVVDRELVEHYHRIGQIPTYVFEACQQKKPLTPGVSVKAKCGFGKPTKVMKDEVIKKKEAR